MDKLTIEIAKRLIEQGYILLSYKKYETKELEVLANLYSSLYDEFNRVRDTILKLETPR